EAAELACETAEAVAVVGDHDLRDGLECDSGQIGPPNAGAGDKSACEAREVSEGDDLPRGGGAGHEQQHYQSQQRCGAVLHKLTFHESVTEWEFCVPVFSWHPVVLLLRARPSVDHPGWFASAPIANW